MSDKDERKRAEEEARRKAEEAARERREEEERRATERAQAAQEAADAQRASAAESFERRPVRPVDDSTEAGRELDALQSLADEPEDRDPTVPAYSMTIPEDEIRTSVTIPENEIRFTPNAVPEPPEDPYARVLAASARMQQGAAPGGRPVNFDALDAQADEADVASAAAAQANLASSPLALPPGAPMPPPQMPPGLPPPPAATPAMAAAGGPLSAPSLPPSMAAPPPPPAPLPQQQQQADARQEAVTPQGARIPQDVRTAAMPSDEPRLAEQEPRLAATSASLPAQGVDTGEPRVSDEDEARSALRQERTMKALGYLFKLAGGIGGAALYNRGGSEVAARLMSSGLGTIGGALTGASPTAQQARISQARRGDDQRAQQGQEMDLRRLSQAAAERRQAMLDEQGASRLDLEGRRVAAMEEGLGLRAEQTSAQAEAARALAAQRERQAQFQGDAAEMERAERDPTSEISRQAQRELSAINSRVPESIRLSDEEIANFTAVEARALRRTLERPLGERRRAMGGPGDGGPARNDTVLGSAPRSYREYLAREYPGDFQGRSEDEQVAAADAAWRRLSATERRPYISGSAAANTRDDDQRAATANSIPGWSLRADVPPPDTVAIRTASWLAASDTTMNRSLGTALSLIDNISLTERGGSALGFDSEQTARFGRAIDAAISEMTSYVNTGALNEADQARYERMFGSLTDLTSNEVIRERLTAIKRELGAKARTRMESLGFQRGGGSGGGGGGATIRVRTPRGIAVRPDTPAERARAERSGFEVLQ